MTNIIKCVILLMQTNSPSQIQEGSESDVPSLIGGHDTMRETKQYLSDKRAPVINFESNILNLGGRMI